MAEGLKMKYGLISCSKTMKIVKWFEDTSYLEKRTEIKDPRSRKDELLRREIL